MPTNALTLGIDDADATTLAALTTFLNDEETQQRREIVDVYLLKSPNDAINEYDYRRNPGAPQLPRLVAEAVPKASAEDFLAQRLADHTCIAYSTLLINKQESPVLVSRPGRVVTVRGKMSTFGGPDDDGMREDEPLAFIHAGNLAAYRAKYPDLFLDRQQANTTPLGRNLNPEAFYVACRWDYEHDIAAADLITCTVRVRNAVTGAEEIAAPADWGPNDDTQRSADLSPGLAAKLGLRTNDECIVTLSGPRIKTRAVGTPAADTGPEPTGALHTLQVFGRAALDENFGDLMPVHENGDGSFEIRNADFQQRIVEADLSPLIGVRGFPNSGKVECHEAIRADLEAAVRELVEAGKKQFLLTWDGLWVPRHILWNASRGFSAHSWAIAFDINVRWNGYGARPAALGETGSVRELVPFFQARGFFWGGYFSTPDGMHFQYGKVPG